MGFYKDKIIYFYTFPVPVKIQGTVKKRKRRREKEAIVKKKRKPPAPSSEDLGSSDDVPIPAPELAAIAEWHSKFIEVRNNKEKAEKEARDLAERQAFALKKLLNPRYFKVNIASSLSLEAVTMLASGEMYGPYRGHFQPICPYNELFFIRKML